MYWVLAIVLAAGMFFAGWRLGLRSRSRVDSADLHTLRDELRAEMHQLLTSKTESSSKKQSTEDEVPTKQGVREPAGEEKLVTDTKTLAVLSAAIAAYLGKQVRIRQARRIESYGSVNRWAQAGRVSIQGSHVRKRR